MPDPIPSSSNSSPYQPTETESVAADPSGGLVCAAPPAQPNASSAAAPASPAVASLVMRFSPPTGSHPPVEPSLAKAAWHCSWELANAALDITGVSKAGGLVSTLLSAGHAVVNVGNAVRCIQRDETQQIADLERANQSADCVRDGAIPILEPDGTIVCGTP